MPTSKLIFAIFLLMMFIPAAGFSFWLLFHYIKTTKMNSKQARVLSYKSAYRHFQVKAILDDGTQIVLMTPGIIPIGNKIKVSYDGKNYMLHSPFQIPLITSIALFFSYLSILIIKDILGF